MGIVPAEQVHSHIIDLTLKFQVYLVQKLFLN